MGSGEPAEGAAAVERMLRDTVILYEDGTPRTHHAVSNLVVEVDEELGVATARSCVTVFQALPGLPLQVIAAGRYEDRFARRGGRWGFVERRVRIRLVGEVRGHLRGWGGRAPRPLGLGPQGGSGCCCTQCIVLLRGAHPARVFRIPGRGGGLATV
ncbi:nuclear transport factor 2 family protein [Streptomyces sp. CMSTAAHL-2]|nr:nuclear transport factor 2 family protein [Streptomyces sp. CMSTAAHL-2]